MQGSALAAGSPGVVSRRRLTPGQLLTTLAPAFRVAVGGTLVFAGLGKMPHIWELFIGLRDVLVFLRIPEEWYQYIRLEFVPPLEIAVGSLLLIGLVTRPAAVASVVLCAAFLVFNLVRLFFTGVQWCNCFGQVLELSIPVVTALDVVMLLASVSVLLYPGRWRLDNVILARRRNSRHGITA